MAVYEWKYSMGVPPQQAGEFLEELERSHGALTPELVLNESRDENAVLHPCFEWDDDKAAEGFRLYQARKILNNITVKIEHSPMKAPQVVRAFINVNDETKKERGKFVAMATIMRNPDYKAQILKNALYELQTFKNKYADYVELEKVFTAIDELAEKIGEVEK